MQPQDLPDHDNPDKGLGPGRVQGAPGARHRLHRGTQGTGDYHNARHVENSYAVSDASVQAGLLHHSLETKPQKLAAPVYVQVRDTIYVQTSSDIQKETIVEIRNELTKGQRRQIVGFWILLATVIAAAAWKIARLFR